MRFIYVFSNKSRDIMLAHGYKLLKSDTVNSIFIFENKVVECFDKSDTSIYSLDDATFSDVLSF